MSDPVFPNDFSGAERQTPIKSDKERQKEWNDDLKKKGPYRIVNTNHLTWIILLLAIGVFGFGYLTLNDYYKPVFVDNSTCTNSCPASPNCTNYCNCPPSLINATFVLPNNLTINSININVTNSS
ncbi:hypothetical protein CCP1ISM_60010 [Azospirillaceae bacterium]